MSWNLKIELIDVASGTTIQPPGIGDSTFITAYTDDKTKCKTMLIDGGRFNKGKIVNDYVNKSLSDEGLNTNVDVIVISHFHEDHYGGIMEILMADNIFVLSKFICCEVAKSINDLDIQNDTHKKNARLIGIYCILSGVYDTPISNNSYQNLRKKVIEKLYTCNNIKCEEINKEINNVNDEYKTHIKGHRMIKKNNGKNLLKLCKDINNSFIVVGDVGFDILNIFAKLHELSKEYFSFSVVRNVSSISTRGRFQKSEIYVSKYKKSKKSLDAWSLEKSNSKNYRYLSRLAKGELNLNGKFFQVPGIDDGRFKEIIPENLGKNLGKELFQLENGDFIPPKAYILAAQQKVWDNNVTDIGNDTINSIENTEKVDKTENINSIALIIRFNDFSYLTCGDLPKEFEIKVADNIMSNMPHSAIPVFKCSHHGSDSSTSEEFLKKIKPWIAFISCGNNAINHPYKSVIERLNNNDLNKIYLTGFNYKNHYSWSKNLIPEREAPQSCNNSKFHVVGNGKDQKGVIIYSISEPESKNLYENKCGGKVTYFNIIDVDLTVASKKEKARKKGKIIYEKRDEKKENKRKIINDRINNKKQCKNHKIHAPEFFNGVDNISTLPALYEILEKEKINENLILSYNNSQYPLCLCQLLSAIPFESDDLDVSFNPAITIYNCILSLEDDNKTLTIEGDCKPTLQDDDHTWPVEGLTENSQGEAFRITVESICITIEDPELSENPESFIITGFIQGKMKISGSTKNISLSYQQDMDDNPWLLALEEENAKMQITDIISLAYNFPFDLPQGIDVFSYFNSLLAVDPAKFFILFYPNTGYESYTNFTVKLMKQDGTPVSWPPVGNIFSLTGIEVNATLRSSSISVVLIGHLTVGGTDMDLGISMSDSRYWLVYIHPTNDERFPGLAALALWIGGDGKLNDDINKGFSALPNVSTGRFDEAISYIDAYVDISACELQTLNIGSILTIGSVNGDASQPLELDIQLALPSLTIDGSLHGDKGLNIRKFLNSLGFSEGSISAVPETLEIASADFHAALKDKNYSISMQIDGIWAIEHFSLNNISFYLGYYNSSLHGSFGCEFELEYETEPGETDSVIIELEAEYGMEQQGFVFKGGIAAGSELNIGHIISMLGKKFGIAESSIPGFLSSMVLKEFHVTYSTADNSFELVCVCDMNAGGEDNDMNVEICIEMSLSHTDAGWNIELKNRMYINDLCFTVDFKNVSGGETIFVAAYDKVRKEGEEPVENTCLHDMVAEISADLARFIPESLVIELNEVKFVYYHKGEFKQFLFGLEFEAGINFQDIPFVGEYLPDDLTAGIKDLQGIFASKAFSKEQVEEINSFFSNEVKALPADELPKGLLLVGELDILGFIIPINTGKKETTKPKTNALQAPGEPEEDPEEETAVVPSEITWFEVNKKLGPLSLQRIGFAFTDSKLTFEVDASLTMGPASLAMSGLSISSPISEFKPVFGLNGFGFHIKRSSFEIGGDFLKSQTNDRDAYYGMVLVHAGTFGLKALGGYISANKADSDSRSSFFIYANINIPLGGPPYLYLTGLAGGFGINNRLKLPTVEELPGYILLPGSAPEQKASAEATVTNVLPQLQKYFIPESGQYWLAAGVSFSSFQMINAFALATVSFGNDLEVALIGSCSMGFPKGAAKPVAYIEIALIAKYVQSTGLFSVEGIVLPASYILGDFCHISGQFAFYMWINPPVTDGGPKAGEFLVSVGGYHPQFKAPSYYPQVPRLALNFNLGPLQVTGEGYFAITPAFMMAGVALNAVWRSGPISASFKIGTDFIMSWAPFEYHSNIYCSVNFSLGKLHASLGTNLEIWGPEFGGKAHIDCWFAHFDIYFGGSKNTKPVLLKWNEFKTQFLPEDTNIIKVSVPAGLRNSDTAGLDWIIEPDNFIIRAATQIPGTELIMNTSSGDYIPEKVWNDKVSIKPMGKNNISSVLNFSLKDENGVCIKEFTLKPVIEDSASSLWGKYSGTAKINDDAFIESTLRGFEISPMHYSPATVSDIPLNLLLYRQGENSGFNFEGSAVSNLHVGGKTNSIAEELVIQSENFYYISCSYIIEIINQPPIKDRRRRILQGISDVGFDTYTEEKVFLDCFASQTKLTDWPEVAKLGGEILTEKI